MSCLNIFIVAEYHTFVTNWFIHFFPLEQSLQLCPSSMWKQSLISIVLYWHFIEEHEYYIFHEGVRALGSEEQWLYVLRRFLISFILLETDRYFGIKFVLRKSENFSWWMKTFLCVPHKVKQKGRSQITLYFKFLLLIFLRVMCSGFVFFFPYRNILKQNPVSKWQLLKFCLC